MGKTPSHSNAMQLNDPSAVVATIMAASEPPEPPPRNPDKINASLKQIVSTESVRPRTSSSKTSCYFGYVRGGHGIIRCVTLWWGIKWVNDGHLVDNWFRDSLILWFRGELLIRTQRWWQFNGYHHL